MEGKNPLQLHVLKRKIEIIYLLLFWKELFPSWSKIHDHNHFNKFLMPHEVPNKNFTNKISKQTYLYKNKYYMQFPPKTVKIFTNLAYERIRYLLFAIHLLIEDNLPSPILHVNSWFVKKERSQIEALVYMSS